MKKIPTFLCLSFLTSNPDSLLVPKYVDQLLKRRIESQYETQFPDTDFRFDDPNCEYSGRYEMLHSTMSLSAENFLWQGRAEFTFDSILAGTRLEFPRISGNNLPVSTDTKTEANSISSKKVWLLGVSLAGLLSGVAFLVNRNRQIDQTRISSFETTSSQASSPEQHPSKGRNSF